MEVIKNFIINNKKFIISLSILFFGNAIFYWGLKLIEGTPVYLSYNLDNLIPFWGWAVYFYNMFYPFCIISFLLLYLKDEKAYYKGIICGIMGCIICYIIYLFFPTIMYRPPIPEYDVFTNFVLKLTYWFDNPPVNCYPSLHCILCFQIMLSFIRSKYKMTGKLIISVLSISIIISTLLIKQHYLYDVIASLLLCIIVNVLEYFIGIYDKLKKKKII